MRGDSFIFSNLYQDSQVTIMGGDVFMLLNSTLTFNALLCSVLLELLFLSVSLLHCIHVQYVLIEFDCVILASSFHFSAYLICLVLCGIV